MEFARFWSQIDRSSGEDGCWRWTGELNSKGYGRFAVEGRRLLAHRVIYELLVGEIPAGLEVCHECDNPPCCNPAHLKLATHRENMQDMVVRGRCKPNRKIDFPTALAMREQRRRGDLYAAIAARYGVSEGAVRWTCADLRYGSRLPRRKIRGETCAAGHARIEENALRRSRGGWECKICHRDRMRRSAA